MFNTAFVVDLRNMMIRVIRGVPVGMELRVGYGIGVL
jgi:hypothetical protein